MHEEKYEWAFGVYWKDHERALSQKARDMLLSGDFVWHEYGNVELADWAAPAVQYCRALEYEIRCRIYNHCPAVVGVPNAANAFIVNKAGWTLGTMEYLYNKQNAVGGDGAHNWRVLVGVLSRAGCGIQDFKDMLIRLCNGRIVSMRNDLAHGDPITQDVAIRLRDQIIGKQGQEGLLSWIVKHLDPVP